MPEWDSLETILDNAWDMLSIGVEQARDPFHTPVLGTVSPYGCSLRTVVLRRVSRAERLVMCHSDQRARKIQDIRADPRVSWHFYHPEQKVQVRLSGQATLHTDDALADRQWAATRQASRRNYGTVDAPGTPSAEPTSGLPETLETRTPTEAESETYRRNFVVIACRIEFLDWLFLRARGHRRVQFLWAGDQLTARWVTP